METVWQDLRYGARLLIRRPGFSAVALLTLALGMSANTTVFSWVHAVLLNPWPGATESHRLVTLDSVTPSGDYIDSSYPDYRDFRDRATTLAGVLAFEDRPVRLGQNEQTEWVWSGMVTGNYFDLLGVHPAAGRFFLPGEQLERPGAFPVAVISHAVWSRFYHADPEVIGRTIQLNQQPFTLVGVAPPDFSRTFGLTFDVWVPLMMERQLSRRGDWLSDRGSRDLHLVARLKDGVPLEEARAEVKTIAAQLAQSYPDSNRGMGAELFPLWQARYGAQFFLLTPLSVLMGVSAFVLLIACANVANLMLARATTRQREIGIRLAVGATRGRLVRQLLVESLLLALLAGGVGTYLALWLIDLLRVFVPPTNLPVDIGAGINYWVSLLLFSSAC